MSVAYFNFVKCNQHVNSEFIVTLFVCYINVFQASTSTVIFFIVISNTLIIKFYWNFSVRYNVGQSINVLKMKQKKIRRFLKNR